MQATRLLGGCPTGEVRITPGFDLPAKWIIHTVGPVWKGGGHNEAQLLQSAYRSSFRLAVSHGVKRIAFPAISTGAYAYPKEAAARIAVESGLACAGEFEAIIYCCYSESDARIYEKTIEDLCK